MIMLNILVNQVFPIFILIGLGFVLAQKFKLDIRTLTKINLYLFVPFFTFSYLYSTAFPKDMLKVLALTVVLMVVNYGASYGISLLRGHDSGMKNAFVNSVIFYNSGNIGIPLITLIFSSHPFIVDGGTPWLDLALTSQIMVLVVQNITVNSLGFFNAGRARLNWKNSLMRVSKVPSIYAIPAAFLLRFVPIDLVQMPFWPSVEYLRNGLISVALITLGVQLSKTRIRTISGDVLLSTLLRLVGGPLFGAGIIAVFSLEGIVAQAAFISTSVPTAVNSALIAVEYDNRPDFASQAVLLSTLLCPITLTLVIYLARILFPVSL